MTSTNKGNYSFCRDCKFREAVSPILKMYPCSYSHIVVRGDVKYERDFKVCLLKETKYE